MAKSWADVNEILDIIFSNETEALEDEGENSRIKNHDSDEDLIGNASGNSSESSESDWEYEDEELPGEKPPQANQKDTAVLDSCETSPKIRKYDSNDITADNINDNNNNNELILSSSPVDTSVTAGTASDFSETMYNCAQNTSTLANFSVIGDTNNGLLPSFSDSVLESVGTPGENININSSDHMYEADLNSEYLPPVDDSPTDSDDEPDSILEWEEHVQEVLWQEAEGYVLMVGQV